MMKNFLYKLPLVLNNGLITALNSINAKYFSSTRERNLKGYYLLWEYYSYSTLLLNSKKAIHQTTMNCGYSLDMNTGMMFLSNSKRRFSSFGCLMDIKNPLALEDGKYATAADIKMPDGLKWVKGDIERKKISFIGVSGGELDEKYLAHIAQSEGKDLNRIEQQLNVGLITEEKGNAEKLGEILKTLNPLTSYTLAFVVNAQSEYSYKTIGQHYLVNSTTKGYDLIKDVYRNLDKVRLRYEFLASDVLMIKYWPLSIKVKDRNFAMIELNALVPNTITKAKVIPASKSKFLSSNFIPLSMQFHVYYGMLLSKQGNLFEFVFNKRIIKVEVVEFMVEHIVSIYESDGSFIGSVLDVRWENGFIRSILNKDINWEDKEMDKATFLHIENFKLINLEYKSNTQCLTTTAKEYIHRDKFLTLDIETYREDKQNIPYACGFYDGKKKKLYYLTDYQHWKDMINAMIDDIMIPKYGGYKVYIHNFNRFDSAFLFRAIESKYKITNPLPRNTGLLSFTVTSYNPETKKRFSLKFTDSIALLPFSLAYLGESFKVSVVKDVFPYNFVNGLNLKYKGGLPDYKYYPQSIDMLIKYTEMANWYNKDNLWDMRNETYLYLSKDIVSLYQILSKMDETIYNNYRINITTKPTIASLAMAILRSNFMTKNSCFAKTKGSVEKAVRSALFGGRNEVFRPIEYAVHSYDFNSLYPYAMLQDLPVGVPVFSLTKEINKIFGFVKVKVTSPDNIRIPILPVRIQTKSGVDKLIFPCGSWTHWYFSEEVKLAIKYGYKVEVIESYIFERGGSDLADYVKNMSFFKDNSTGAIRNIHKLLMNTPYGRLGMKNIRDVVKIVSTSEYEEIIKRYKILDAFQLSNDKIFVKHSKHPSKVACEQSGINFEEESMKAIDNDFVDNSTPIAAAIASWSRIIMYPFILDSAYTDTDSVFLKKKLPTHMIGNGLGKFKEEYGGQIYKAIFISPKLYYLNTVGGEISKSKGISLNLTKFSFNVLFKGLSIDIEEERWVRSLCSESVTVINHKMNISGEYDKRKKLFSKGKWVDTSPLIINHLFEVIPTDLVIYENKYLIPYSQPSKNLDLITIPDYTLFDVIVTHLVCSENKYLIPYAQPSKNLSLICIYDYQYHPNYSTEVLPSSNSSHRKSGVEFPVTVHELEHAVRHAIGSSKSLVANETQMVIYRLTGLLHSEGDDGLGIMYYYIKKGNRLFTIRIKEKGVWCLNPNQKIVGGFLYLRKGMKWILFSDN